MTVIHNRGKINEIQVVVPSYCTFVSVVVLIGLKVKSKVLSIQWTLFVFYFRCTTSASKLIAIGTHKNYE